jgi:hypothetical protein
LQFTEAERDRIILTEVITLGNPIDGSPGGNNTVDYIFLLSIEEAQSYFTDDSSRVAVVKLSDNMVEYLEDYYCLLAKDYRSYNGEKIWWWLRSPGNNSEYPYRSYDDSCNISYVGKDGIIRTFGTNDQFLHGIRPALWLSI